MKTRKLHKNFLNEKQTIETMYDSCGNGCSCSSVSCSCTSDQSKSYNVNQTFQNQHTNAFKNGAW